MANVKVKALQSLYGVYGMASEGDEIELPYAHAKELAQRGAVYMEGVSKEPPKKTGIPLVVPVGSGSPHLDSDKTINTDGLNSGATVNATSKAANKNVSKAAKDVKEENTNSGENSNTENNGTTNESNPPTPQLP